MIIFKIKNNGKETYYDYEYEFSNGSNIIKTIDYYLNKQKTYFKKYYFVLGCMFFNNEIETYRKIQELEQEIKDLKNEMEDLEDPEFYELDGKIKYIEYEIQKELEKAYVNNNIDLNLTSICSFFQEKEKEKLEIVEEIKDEIDDMRIKISNLLEKI